MRQVKLDERKVNAAIQHCPLLCGLVCRADDMRRHIALVCPKRTIKCAACGDVVKEQAVYDAHLRNYCVKRTVNCPRLHIGCTARIPFEKVQFHMDHRCLKRTVMCRLECGTKLHFDKRPDHEENKCRERMTDCAMGCGAWIPISKESKHAFVCKHRPVECGNECGEMMRECDREHHEAVDCIYVPKPCPLGCGDTISPPSKLRLHMKAFCPLRVVACERECGVEGLLARDEPHHTSSTCPLRPVLCNIGCGLTMPLVQQPKHEIKGECGFCPRRLVRCCNGTTARWSSIKFLWRLACA